MTSVSDKLPYDDWYKVGAHWTYRPWLYVPLLRALVRRGNLHSNATILDAGCGQGWFTHMLGKLGYTVTGADVSSEGISYARQHYGSKAKFVVCDLSVPNHGEQFDCVFTRSFGLYDLADFSTQRYVTENLLTFVKPGGLLLFVHHSKPWQQIYTTWHHHTLAQTRAHFSPYDATVHFVLRPEVFILRGLALNRLWASSAELLSRMLKVGGELIAIVRKPGQ